MVAMPSTPVDEYTGPSFQGFVFNLTNPGVNNSKTWTLTITSQVAFANYTALIEGTWEGGGGNVKNIQDGQITANGFTMSFEYQNGNIKPVTGDPGTSYFSGDLSFVKAHRVGKHHIPAKWTLQGAVTTTDGDGNVLGKEPGVVSGEVFV
jgi:hypothetical protein